MRGIQLPLWSRVDLAGPVLGPQVRAWACPPATSHSLPAGKVSCLAQLQCAPDPGLIDSDLIIRFSQLPRQTPWARAVVGVQA